jgi:hypothetical protein
VLSTQDPAPVPIQFLASRILFLITAFGGETNRVLVDELGVGEVLAKVSARVPNNNLSVVLTDLALKSVLLRIFLCFPQSQATSHNS